VDVRFIAYNKNPDNMCAYVQAAEEALNVFHPVTYEGVVDIDKESDPLKR
jgi:hypothetical protein